MKISNKMLLLASVISVLIDNSTAALAGGYDSTTDQNPFLANGTPVMTLTGSTRYAQFLGGASFAGPVTFLSSPTVFSPNVGIGTASPTWPLDVNSTDAWPVIANNGFGHAIDAFGHRLSASPHFIGFYSEGPPSAPSYPKARDTLAAFEGRDFINPAVNGSGMIIRAEADHTATSQPTSISLQTMPVDVTDKAVEAVHIGSNGNVGIGTTNPSGNLDIEPTSSQANHLDASGNSAPIPASLCLNGSCTTSISGRSQQESSGYQELPSGLVMQWAKGPNFSGQETSNSTKVPFPIHFQHSCFNVQVTAYFPNGDDTNQNGWFQVTGCDQSGVNVLLQNASVVPNKDVYPMIFAIGN